MVDLQAIPYDSTNETGGCVTHGMVWACPTPAGASLLQNLVGSPRPRLNTVFIPCALFLREKGSSGEAHLQSFYGCLTGARIVGLKPRKHAHSFSPMLCHGGTWRSRQSFRGRSRRLGSSLYRPEELKRATYGELAEPHQTHAAQAGVTIWMRLWTQGARKPRRSICGTLVGAHSRATSGNQRPQSMCRGGWN